MFANKVRYFHGNHPNPNFPQFTIAYHRIDESVILSWAVVHPKDTYDKQRGREVTYDRLAANLDFLCVANEEGFSVEECVGIISAKTLLEPLTAHIADHVTQKMSLMDVKHSYVATMLAEHVISIIKAQKQL